MEGGWGSCLAVSWQGTCPGGVEAGAPGAHPGHQWEDGRGRGSERPFPRPRGLDWSQGLGGLLLTGVCLSPCRHHVGQGGVPVLSGCGAGRRLCAAGPARHGPRYRRLPRGVCAQDPGALAAEARRMGEGHLRSREGVAGWGRGEAQLPPRPGPPPTSRAKVLLSRSPPQGRSWAAAVTPLSRRGGAHRPSPQGCVQASYPSVPAPQPPAQPWPGSHRRSQFSPP